MKRALASILFGWLLFLIVSPRSCAEVTDSIPVVCKYNGRIIKSLHKVRIEVHSPDTVYHLSISNQSMAILGDVCGTVQLVFHYKNKAYVMPTYPYEKLRTSSYVEINIARLNAKYRKKYDSDYILTIISSGIGTSEKGNWK